MSVLRERTRGASANAADVFDGQFGVDTSGCIPLSRLDIRHENWIHGVQCQAIEPATFRRTLAESSVGPEGFTFIDYGAGKGRAVLLAAEQPFDRVVGVEFSHELIELARTNLARYPSGRIRASDVEFVCSDAAEFELPAVPLILYLYNPFNEIVMRRVVDNVCASLRSHPRPLVALYVNPQCPAPWDGAPGLTLRTAVPDLRVYASASVPTAGLPSEMSIG
jgi:SAM-dependent methyltransferase